MRVGHDGFFHLTYCSNIHAGEKWSEVFGNLKKYIPPLKKSLSPKMPFGIGLRLSNQSANGLLQGKQLNEFKTWLYENQLYVFTINGFPYGVFHQQPIKEYVYLPDWVSIERRDYSLKLVKILAELTPEGCESGFSTCPLSYKPWLTPQKSVLVLKQASLYFAQIVAEMFAIYSKSGKLIHIDIEAEPDCLIETTQEIIHFFNHWLIPVGSPYLAKLIKVSLSEAEILLRRHIQFCYDVCHLSVEYENPNFIFKQLAAENIQIGKIQISAALKTKISDNLSLQNELSKHLHKFDDPIYLHQVIGHHVDGSLQHFKDLKFAISHLKEHKLDELRSHFHIPIFWGNYQILQSTQDDVSAVLQLLQKNKATQHLEIETYTWDVLPPDLKLDIVSSIEREYKWVLQQFNQQQKELP